MNANNQYYELLKVLEDKILAIPETNSVTTGDLSRVDIRKKTIFPLAHIVINSIGQSEQVLRYNVTILCMDIVNTNKNQSTDILRGNDNEQDVLNTRSYILNRIIQSIRGGDLKRNGYEVEGEITIEFFADRFENNLAGAEATFDIFVPNDIDICN